MPSNDNLLNAQREADNILRKMRELKAAWSEARQVVALRDRRIDKELAVLVVEGLDAKLSATAAEWRAKADKRYHQAIVNIITDCAKKESVLAEWRILEKHFEHCQAEQNNERARMKII